MWPTSWLQAGKQQPSSKQRAPAEMPLPGRTSAPWYSAPKLALSAAGSSAPRSIMLSNPAPRLLPAAAAAAAGRAAAAAEAA